MRFAIFPLCLSKVLRLPRKSIRSAAPVTQNHLPKTEDLVLQNATLLRKPAPSPTNISDENVSCTAPATENASLCIFQILFKCPTPAIVFRNATKLLTLDKVRKTKTTLQRPKVAQTCGALCTF